MQISRFAQQRLAIFERTLGWLDAHASRQLSASTSAPHLTVGLRGEDAAYFQLRRLNYTIVARRWRSPKLRGDIDLIGWDGEWLCFVEVKTRSSKSFEPAEAAVDRDKRQTLCRMAREYVRQIESTAEVPVRFDVMSVYFSSSRPEFELFRGAFTWN